jgi:protein SCO1/2
MSLERMVSDPNTKLKPAVPPGAPPAPSEERLFLAIVLGLALVAGAGSWLTVLALTRHEHLQGRAPDHPRQLADFSLTDRSGRQVGRADLDGKVLAVSFLLTSCSLTCPVVSRHMAAIQQLMAGEPDVQLVSLTVDPRTDTPAALARFGSRFGAETNRWFLLTGDKPVLYGLIGASFLAQDNNDPFNTMPGHFTGTDRIAIVDKHGRTRAYFDGLSDDTPAAAAVVMARLRNEP